MSLGEWILHRLTYVVQQGAVPAGTRLSPGFTMVYGPRTERELATVLGIVAASHAYATGSESVAAR